MRRLLPMVLLAACVPAAAAVRAGHAEVHGLIEVGRTPLLTAALAYAADGLRWLAGGEGELIAFAGDREIARFAGLGDDGLPLTANARGWAVGGRILAADGTVRFDGYSWAQRFGRFGSAHALAVTPDGGVAIVSAHDSPSACLCDRARGHEPRTYDGAVVRLTFGAGAPVERVLVPHAGRADYAVAASADSLAAITGEQLEVWPARGDGPPLVAAAPAGLQHLAWVGDRYLAATRSGDGERDEVVIFDRAAHFAHTSFVADGTVAALAARPGARELALVINRYRAHTTVEIDEHALEVVGLAGARHVRVELASDPLAVAWSPDGETVLTSVGEPAAAVVRYEVR